MSVELHVISAGAAQSVVQQVARILSSEHGVDVQASFGAVGAQKQKLLTGAAADVIILTAAMIDALIAAGEVVAGSRADLGAVGGGIAVRKGTRAPEVATPDALRASLLAAAAIYIPDPAIATAGQQFVKMCERLAIAAAVRPKLKLFPNGFTAMTHLGQSTSEGEIGCTQVTEIKLVSSVDLIAPLPQSLQHLTTYSLGIVARAGAPDRARAFAHRLTGPAARDMLVAAGFVVD